MNKPVKNIIKVAINVEQERKENDVKVKMIEEGKVEKDDVKSSPRDMTSKYLMDRVCPNPNERVEEKLKNENYDFKLGLGEHDKMPIKQTLPDMTLSTSSRPPIEIAKSSKKRKSNVLTITKNSKLETSVKEIKPSSGEVNQLFGSTRQSQSASLQLQLSTLFEKFKNDADNDDFNLDLGEYDKLPIKQILPDMTLSTSSRPPIEIATSSTTITKKAKLKTSVEVIKASSDDVKAPLERVKLKKSTNLQLQSQSNKATSSNTISSVQSTKQKPISSNHPSQVCLEIDKNDVKGSVGDIISKYFEHHVYPNPEYTDVARSILDMAKNKIQEKIVNKSIVEDRSALPQDKLVTFVKKYIEFILIKESRHHNSSTL